MIEWSPNFEVGHPKIDDQHHQLVRLFNRFTRALDSKGENRESEIRNSFCALALYTDIHYRMEEHLMVSSRYPRMEEHLLGHEKVKQSIKNVIEAFNENFLNEVYLTNLISEWVPQIPISRDDLDLANWLKNQ